MNTAIIGALIEHPSVFVGKFIAEPLAGAALAYGLVWLAMRPKDGRKMDSSFLWHSCGVAATVIGSAIFRIIAMVTFAGRSAYELSSVGGVAGFYMLTVPAIFAAAYIMWLKKRIVYDGDVVSNTTSQQQSFPDSTKAAPISSGQRAVQNIPSASQSAIAARAVPAVTKESAVDHPPPVNAVPSVAIEFGQQPMQQIEDRLYEQIAQEIETNAVDKASWAKAFAQAGGDDKQTRVAYIKARFEKLMAAENTRLEALQREREEVARREQELREHGREEAERFELLRKRINVAESAGLDDVKKLATSVEAFDFLNWCCCGFIAKVKEAVEKIRCFWLLPIVVAILHCTWRSSLNNRKL